MERIRCAWLHGAVVREYTVTKGQDVMKNVTNSHSLSVHVPGPCHFSVEDMHTCGSCLKKKSCNYAVALFTWLLIQCSSITF